MIPLPNVSPISSIKNALETQLSRFQWLEPSQWLLGPITLATLCDPKICFPKTPSMPCFQLLETIIFWYLHWGCARCLNGWPAGPPGVWLSTAVAVQLRPLPRLPLPTNQKFAFPVTHHPFFIRLLSVLIFSLICALPRSSLKKPIIECFTY